MESISGLQGLGGRQDLLMQALQMSSSGGIQQGSGPMQSNYAMPFDRTNFSQDIFEGQGQGFNNPFSSGSSNNVGFNNGSGMVPGFGGFSPAMMGGQQQQMQQMMQQMMMMIMMMIMMMQKNGMGDNQQCQQQGQNFNNPIGMGNASASASAGANGASASSSAGGSMPANYGNYFPNSTNPYQQGNTLGSMTNGSLGQNGMNLGQGLNNGGGNVYNPTQYFDNVMQGFGQGTEGNCTSVATIKAAMDHFGDKVFENVQRTQDGGYSVKMRDGQQINLTAAEMQTATQKSGFKGEGTDEQQYGTLCYAAMAKRAQGEKNDGAQNYSQACDSLNNGEWPQDTARFLGLQNNVQSVDPSNIQGQDGVVAWNSKHTIFVDNTGGNTMADNYGQAQQFDGTDTKDRSLTDAMKFIG